MNFITNRFLKNASFIWLLFTAFGLNAQTRDYSDWTDYGSVHVSKWLMIAPGKLGANALPVPRMNYGTLQNQHSLEIGTDIHLMTGDQGYNSYFNLKWNIAPEKVLVEIWGNPTETFKMTNKVRDERQIYYDDEGWITHQGDLWISTYLQLLKDHPKLPDIVLNYSMSLTTGIVTHGRYIDAPISFMYLSSGKSIQLKNFIFDEIRIAGMFGWYIWQTNKVEMAQDEGPLTEIGLKLKRNKFSIAQEVAGYLGYDAYEFIGQSGYNDPIIYRSRIEYQAEKVLLKAEYQTGIKDYSYQTFRLSGTVYF